MNKIGIRVLTLSAVLGVSTLCLQAAIANQGPTANKGPEVGELHSFNLNPEINSVQGHKLTLRSLRLEPGGVVNLHSKDHPAVLQVIKGILTSHPQGKPEVVLRAGGGLAQGKDSDCWVQNTGSEAAEFIWLPIYEASP